MSKTVEEMYQELIEQAATFGEMINPGSQYLDDDDDSEDFMTSKEIIKTKEDIKEKFGIDDPINDGVIEEDVHFKTYSKKYQHKYTDKEMEEIRKSCECTIVHDYGEHDIYHLSDEERAENDER